MGEDRKREYFVKRQCQYEKCNFIVLMRTYHKWEKGQMKFGIMPVLDL